MERNHEENPQQKHDLDESKRRTQVCLQQLTTLEATFRVELNAKEKQAYLDKLKDVPLMDLTAAVDDCQRNWRPQFGVSFPPLYDLLDFVNVAHGRRLLNRSTKEILQRDDKPLEKADLTKAAIRLNVSKAQVDEWLEAGKQSQRQHIAKLAIDADWQALYEKFGKPGLSPRPQRTWESEDAKWQWVSETAEKQGWKR